VFIRNLLFALLIIALSSFQVEANMVQVPGDFQTIQSAINVVSSGDTVLVADGTYPENINFRGKNIVLASQFLLDKNPEHILNTIIDGSAPAHPDTASCVLFISGEDSSAVLQGFTLTGGSGTKWPDIHIGGFYREGGGILIELSSPTIRNNRIINNQAINTSGVTSAGGGAIRCGDGNPLIINNIIMNNQGRYGAGIVLNFSGGIIRNNIICQNNGGQDYGGSGIWMYSNGAHPKIIENNTIAGNTSSGSGAYGGKGGALLVWSTSMTGRNNIIWGNLQSSSGQIALLSGGTVNMTYSDAEGGWTGQGNIDLNPAFADTNYYLSPTSPAVDAGDPDPVYNDPEDPNNPGNAKWPARGGLRNDIGGYGGPLAQAFPLFLITDIILKNITARGFRLDQNYPNPFNPMTTIQYQVPTEAKVRLEVYDLLGRKVATLLDRRIPAGYHEVSFDASSLASGVYIYRLVAGSFSKTRKMMVMK